MAPTYCTACGGEGWLPSLPEGQSECPYCKGTGKGQGSLPRNSALCDKCGQRVPAHNDAVRVHAIFSGDGLMLITARARHFLPTAICSGSPSRAQYIEGQPHDTRYPYDATQEARWRAAYAQLQKEHPHEHHHSTSSD